MMPGDGRVIARMPDGDAEYTAHIYIYIYIYIYIQAAHRTTDYMYKDTGVENSSLYRAATAGLVAKLSLYIIYIVCILLY